MKTFCLLVFLVFTASCQNRKEVEDKSFDCPINRTEHDSFGVKRRWKQSWNNQYNRCDREVIPLSYYEQGIRKRNRLNINCSPQNTIPTSTSLVAANNYYEYRDNKYFLHLDPGTGVYRRILRGEDKSGKPAYSKELGCFYVREDFEDEPWGETDYGIQIYLEQPKSASSNIFKANEVYRITNMNIEWNLTSFSSISDWTHQFCPSSGTPWGYCDLLRNGNIMYDSNLSSTDKSNLKAEAILIRTQYNFLEISSEQFEDEWEKSFKEENEVPQIDFKYQITFMPDAPYFTEQAWVSYIKGERPFMPDISIIKQIPVCYSGFKKIQLDNGGTSLIRGEICYEDGKYQFTQF